jgi:hypothetical protein
LVLGSTYSESKLKSFSNPASASLHSPPIAVKGEAYDLAVIATRDAVPDWKFRPVAAVGMPNAYAASIADDLRRDGLPPDEEKNDALLVGESAILGAQMLLTSDGHLLDLDFGKAAAIVSSYGFALPVVAEPRDIVKKFATRE